MKKFEMNWEKKRKKSGKNRYENLRLSGFLRENENEQKQNK